MEPTLRQRRLALAFIGMLSIGFVAIAPFAAKQVVQIASFVPTKTRAIRVGTELQGEKAVVISVEDSGPGIERKKMDTVFDAFVTTKATGMGLGLALSQMIIERHGGQMVVVPSANNGAHFRITLPIESTALQG